MTTSVPHKGHRDESGLLFAEDMEPLYREWVDSGAHLYEGDEYGHERAAFYAGFAAGRAGDPAVTAPCRASTQVGCPDGPARLVCHQPGPHPGLNHYDAAERLWWARTDAEPVLWHELAAREVQP